MRKSVKDMVESRFVIEKSEFISFLYPIKDSFEAKSIIKDLRKEFNDATHVVHAYILDNEAHSTDDGEPSGTAGLPTLEVLRKADLVNVLGVTIRYFGGIKLGAGGLVRAYTKSISDAVEMAEITEETTVITFRLSFDYKHTSFIDRKLRNIIQIEKTYDESINYIITMKTDDYTKFIESLSPLGMNYRISDETLEKRFL
jgi:uncharacterized YigZ family protein